MGLTHVEITVRKALGNPVARTAQCLVDSGATATVLPAELLREIGVAAVDEQVFRLADGSKITRPRGWAYVELGGRGAYSRVVFGEPGDSNLIGVLTLEELELFLDPLHRELHNIEQSL